MSDEPHISTEGLQGVVGQMLCQRQGDSAEHTHAKEG